MKKLVLIYLVTVFSTGFLLTLISLFEIVRWDIAFFFLVDSLGLLLVYLHYKYKTINSLIFMAVLNLFQSVKFVCGGLVYQFIQGLNISLNIEHAPDVKVGFAFHIFESKIIFRQVPDNSSFLLSIHFVQLSICIYMIYLANHLRIKK